MRSLKSGIFFFSLLNCISVNAQFGVYDDLSRYNIKFGSGITTYYGDLQENARIINAKTALWEINAGMTYDISEKFLLRLDLSFLKLQGSDKNSSRPDLMRRNLSFNSNVYELSISGQYDFLSTKNFKHQLTPYLFAGAGFIHFNPWTIDRNGEKVYLHNLHTEGLGLASFPKKKQYSLWQPTITMGAGIKYAITQTLSIHAEFWWRYIFTDYLDDVGGKYPDPIVLLNDKGLVDPAKTIGLTWRRDELDPNDRYQSFHQNVYRGGSLNDIYHSVNVSLYLNFKDIPFLDNRSSLSPHANPK